MPKEQSYINLACQVLGVQEDTLLKSYETGEGVVIINAAGQKFTFSFEYLEDYKQYVEDNKPKPAPKPRKTTPKTKKSPASRSKIIRQVQND